MRAKCARCVFNAFALPQAFGGHYYAYIRDFARMIWCEFNDSKVTHVDEARVRSAFGTGPSAKFPSAIWGKPGSLQHFPAPESIFCPVEKRQSKRVHAGDCALRSYHIPPF